MRIGPIRVPQHRTRALGTLSRNLVARQSRGGTPDFRRRHGLRRFLHSQTNAPSILVSHPVPASRGRPETADPGSRGSPRLPKSVTTLVSAASNASISSGPPIPMSKSIVLAPPLSAARGRAGGSSSVSDDSAVGDDPGSTTEAEANNLSEGWPPTRPPPPPSRQKLKVPTTARRKNQERKIFMVRAFERR